MELFAFMSVGTFATDFCLHLGSSGTVQACDVGFLLGFGFDFVLFFGLVFLAFENDAAHHGFFDTHIRNVIIVSGCKYTYLQDWFLHDETKKLRQARVVETILACRSLICQHLTAVGGMVASRQSAAMPHGRCSGTDRLFDQCFHNFADKCARLSFEGFL